jgi:hypothetical protein
MPKADHIYKIAFFNQSKLYEIYAKLVNQAPMYDFIEITDIIFDDSNIVLDPAEEKIKNEFDGVKSTYIPMHSVIRIDYVEKRGTSKVQDINPKDKVSYFPSPIYTPEKK